MKIHIIGYLVRQKISRKKLFSLFVITYLFLILKPSLSYSQDDTTSYIKNFSIKGYVDAYYAWDTDKDKTERQFPAFEPYRDQFKLNIAQISLDYNSDKIRGKMTIQYGDIPVFLWPSNQQYIQEANVGFSPYKGLWIDAGYFLTHIGAEGFPINSFFSSYAMGSYYEPNYQSGLRISYDFSEKFNGSLHILNGYNMFDDNNKNKSFGLQLVYKPVAQLSFVYNNIIGNEMPSSENNPKTRILNNFITYYSPNDKLDFIFGIDFTAQEKSGLSDSTASASMFAVMLSGRYKITPKFYLSLMGEYLKDTDGFLSGTFMDSDGNITGLNIFGITGALEYRPVENYFLRLESRFLSAENKLKIFYNNSNTRTEITLNTGLEF